MAPLHPFIPVPGAIRIALEGNQAGRPFANVFHAQYSGAAPTDEQLNEYGGVLYENIAGEFASLANQTATYEQMVLTDLSSISGAQTTLGVATPGGLTGDPIPSNSALLLNYNSSFRYRGGHPRSYVVAGDVTSINTPNQWTDAFLTLAGSAALTVHVAFANAAGSGLAMIGQCAVSYRTLDAYRVTPLIMPIGSVSVNPGIASMRRRMRK